MPDENDKPRNEAAPKVARPCPICSKPADERYKPFCSKRCADIDLGRWLGGRYAIPATEDDADGADDSPPPYREH